MPTLNANTVIPEHSMPEMKIDVKTQYVKNQSIPDEEKYVFAYHVDIYNPSHHTVQLITRHWLITDGNGKLQEIQGDGVVGDSPTLAPGESYQYSSGAVLSTEVGSMSGHYGMRLVLETEAEIEEAIESDDLLFKADIPVFTLAVPSSLH